MNLAHKKQRSILIDCFDTVNCADLTDGFKVIAGHNGVSEETVECLYRGDDTQFSQFHTMLERAKNVVENWSNNPEVERGDVSA